MSPEEIGIIKGEMMKVHTIMLTTNISEFDHHGIVPRITDAQSVEGVNTTDKITQINNLHSGKLGSNNGILQEEEKEIEDRFRLDHSTDSAYKLLSGRAKLNSPKSQELHLEHVKNRASTNNTEESEDEDVYVVPNKLQREEIMKSVYNFDKDPIFIPDEVKNRDYTKHANESLPVSKKLKMSETSGEDIQCPSNETLQDNVDLDTMLGTFVDKLIDE